MSHLPCKVPISVSHPLCLLHPCILAAEHCLNNHSHVGRFHFKIKVINFKWALCCLNIPPLTLMFTFLLSKTTIPQLSLPLQKLQTNPTSKLSLTNDVVASFTWQSRHPIGNVPASLSVGNYSTCVQCTSHPLHPSQGSPSSYYSFSISYLKFLPVSLIIFISKQVCPSYYPLLKKFFYLTSAFHLPPHLDPLHNHPLV